MIEQAIRWLVDFVEHFGYIGIFIMTLLESTFVPIPSEATLVPAGYLVQQGAMEGWLVFLCATLGTLTGSLINYWFALKAGRSVILRFGKYLFLDDAKLAQVERFFQSHGPISIFTGRLILGVRHFIAFPAGLGRMPLKPFILYTVLGGALWTLILLTVGYVIGSNKALLARELIFIKLGVVAVAMLGIAFYIWRHKRKS